MYQLKILTNVLFVSVVSDAVALDEIESYSEVQVLVLSSQHVLVLSTVALWTFFTGNWFSMYWSTVYRYGVHYVDLILDGTGYRTNSTTVRILLVGIHTGSWLCFPQQQTLESSVTSVDSPSVMETPNNGPSTKTPPPTTLLLLALQDASESLVEAVQKVKQEKESQATLSKETESTQPVPSISPNNRACNITTSTATTGPLKSHATQEYDDMDASIAAFMAAQDKQSRLNLDDWARLLVKLGDATTVTTDVTVSTATTETNATAEQGHVPTPILVNKSRSTTHIDKLICTFQTELMR